MTPKNETKKPSLHDVILKAADFGDLEIEPRAAYLAPWLKESSISLIYGWRGCGKTWAALGIVNAVSKGESFGPWKCETPVRCLFLDGEMAVHDILERVKALELDAERDCSLYIYSDSHANSLGLPRAHLANRQWRGAMKQFLIARKVKLWVIDNLASLASGLDENKKQDWDPVNQWLLELRFAGVSTILLHHVGKLGLQRGTSAREDNLDISVQLKPPSDYIPEDGARFIMHFSKARVKTADLQAIADTEFKLIQDDTGHYEWTYRNVRAETKREVLRLLGDGHDQKAIAETLAITKGRVSQIRKEAVNENYLTQKNKLTQSGFLYVSEH